MVAMKMRRGISGEKIAAYRVDAVGDDHAGLERLAERAYDVILSDVRMPGMDFMLRSPGCWACERPASPRATSTARLKSGSAGQTPA